MPVAFEQVSYRYSSQGSPQDASQDPSRGSAAEPALDGLSFEVADGEFLGIIGHTGSGKSTLIQHINGLLQPSSGRVLIDGVDLADKAARREARHKVGMVFQKPEQQLFARTVAEDVAFGPHNAGMPPAEIDSCVDEALERVGLAPSVYRERSPFELSGGEKRLVAFAGIIACHPKILVLDEPTASLDPMGARRLMSIVEHLHQQGTTIIMVSHSMETIARYSQRILVLNEGSIFALGTPEEVFSRSDELRRINLGVPGATAFASALNDCGFHLSNTLYTTEALADAIADELAAVLGNKEQGCGTHARGASGDGEALGSSTQEHGVANGETSDDGTRDCKELSREGTLGGGASYGGTSRIPDGPHKGGESDGD